MKTLRALAKNFEEIDVEIAGKHVHYAEANRGASKPIFVVHGLTGTHYSMFQMAGVWAEQGKHVIAIDLPGHGASDEIQIRTFDDVADWLDGVIARLIPKGDFTLVGNSFGCSVAVAYTHKFGLRGESQMVLTAPIPSIPPLYYRLERLTAGVPDRIARVLYYENRLVEPLRISVLLGDSRNTMLRSRVSESIRSEGHMVNHRYAFLALMPAHYAASPLSKKLPQHIARRTRSFSGDADEIAPKNVHDHMKNIIGEERVIRIDNCGHLVHIEGVNVVTAYIDK